MRGTHFKAVLIKKVPKNTKLIISSNLVVVRPKFNYPHFIVMYLNSEAFQKKYIETKDEALLNLSIKEARKFELPSPNQEQRILLHELFFSTLEKVEALNAEIKATQLLMEATLFAQSHLEEN